jgi:hypothetical protein
VSQAAEEAFLQGTLKGARRAREGVLIPLPEGYFLFPGEKGRPVYGKPSGLERALRYRGLLLGHGLRLVVVRGHETSRFAGE